MYLMFLTKCSGDVRVLSLLQRKYDSDGKMTSSIIRQKIILLLQYKTPKIRPVSQQGGFVLYCSEHRLCYHKTGTANAERGSCPCNPKTHNERRNNI